MAFKIKARTLLHLGAELISSDAVALFELVKNAYDAKSKTGATIEILVKLPSWPGKLAEMVSLARKPNSPVSVESLGAALLQDLDMTAPGAAEWAEQVRNVRNLGELCRLACEANSITVRDTGHGMSLEELEDVFLTIGTRSRLRELGNQGGPVLGEKGLGRLSVMRLGSRVRIVSKRLGEVRRNELEIDWTRLSHDSEEMLEEFPATPRQQLEPADPREEGTTVEIWQLSSRWGRPEVENFARHDACKLNDPFSPRDRYPLKIQFNGKDVEIRDFEKYLLDYAHANVRAEYRVGGSAARPTVELEGVVDYRAANRSTDFRLALPELTNITGVDGRVLWALGPFSVTFYWFNRQALQHHTEDGVPIRELVNEWSGGLMLFRDNFRVLPHGSKNDDWLDLDSRALASAGYKVNRKQIVGKVDISRRANPALVDQSNREGLRDCPEQTAFVKILKHIIEAQFRAFLNAVDAERRANLHVTFDDVGERMEREQRKLRATIRLLVRKHPQIKQETALLQELEASTSALEAIMKQTEELAGEFERGRAQVIHLAGIGLLVEMISHELGRATINALRDIAAARGASGRVELQPFIEPLEAQLQTIQKRLGLLDPASVARRQVKETFDLAELARQVLAGHEAQFRANGIKAEVLPKNAELKVKMVKGMVIQVLENLLSNSIYWLKHRQVLDSDFKPFIRIELIEGAREMRVTDSGSGVGASMADKIFHPFVTTKPPGEGKGLGLYIAQEVARYHGATLRLAPDRSVHPDRFNTFVLTLPKP